MMPMAPRNFGKTGAHWLKSGAVKCTELPETDHCGTVIAGKFIQDDPPPGAGEMVGFGGPYFTMGAITPYIGRTVIDDGSRDPATEAFAIAIQDEINAKDETSTFLNLPTPKSCFNLITHGIYNNYYIIYNKPIVQALLIKWLADNGL
jgi:hypothetical protein